MAIDARAQMTRERMSSSSSERRRSSGGTKADHGKRLDIQGLRMVAVLSVVVNHISERALPGGFVGVDVFFVISGFLITGRLIRTVGTSSTASYFGSFYKLRTRRILPAAVVTLLATVIVARIVFYGERAQAVTVDAIWALFFGANWHFADAGTNYFNQNQATSPVQHYWSLSVEEQFYVAWPVIVLIAGAWLGRRRPDRVRVVVGGAAAIVVVASLAWGWHQTSVAPTPAYFSTFSRAWELAVGALLATMVASKRALPASLATPMSWVGLGVVTYAVVATPGGESFPVPWALPAVIGSALVILAGITRQPANGILRNRLSVWLGDLSYSIYLVHFPIWIFIGAIVPDRDFYFYGSVAAGTLAASVASYYFVEEPGRRGLEALIPEHESDRRKLGINFVLAMGALVVAMVIALMRPITPPYEPALALQEIENNSGSSDPSIIDPLPDVQDAVLAGLKASSWPTMTNENSFEMVAGCNNFASVAEACHWDPEPSADTGQVVLLIGDSVMRSWLPMMENAFVPMGWKVVSIAQDDCFAAAAPYADELQGGGKLAENENCDAQHAFYPSALEAIDPDLVIMDNMSAAIYKVSDGEGHLLPHDQQTATYLSALKDTISLVQKSGAEVLVLSATPDHEAIEDCRVGSAGPQECVARIAGSWQEVRRLDVQATEETKATYADLQNFFCFGGLCPPVVDNIKVVIDNHHITQEYANYLAPSFARYLEKSGVLKAAASGA